MMRRSVLAAGAAIVASLTMAASAQQIPGPYGTAVTLAQARAIVDAAHAEARRRSFLMAFTVTLPSGEPILLEVMDGTQLGSIDIAQAKARTSARFRRPTKAYADNLAAGNLGAMTVDGVLAIEGGVPIVAGGRVIGALGVSGGTAVQDGEVAAVALAAVKLD
jgi:glc operon protein GlcG